MSTEQPQGGSNYREGMVVAARDLAPLRELLRIWDRWQARNPRVEAEDIRQYLYVAGFAVQGFEQARAYLSAVRRVPETALVPLVRAVFEQAVTAQWVALVPDGWKALTQHSGEERSKTAKEFISMGEEPWTQWAEQIRAQLQHDPANLANDHTHWGANFKDRCRELTPSKDFYAHYRLMSEETHPTAGILHQWVRMPLETGGAIRVVKPDVGVDLTWPHQLLTSMIWLAQAVCMLEGNVGRQNYLDRVARDNGAIPRLELSEEHHKRIRKAARRAAREAARATPISMVSDRLAR
ncbi:DUF5677 domain-containing protein [Kocuria turfanensis]|uniref:Uncharacterized protein n=1 Tax=Kocuria turfanensis TaxID=388357 RepID=A0A512II18_9MICC|nr:DUF5677 domain-containing protein [Kocuria turfanensis]GEO97307.1 hypothetical protein KTU01_34300 [Kocuria turfanensis]